MNTSFEFILIDSINLLKCYQHDSHLSEGYNISSPLNTSTCSFTIFNLYRLHLLLNLNLFFFSITKTIQFSVQSLWPFVQTDDECSLMMCWVFCWSVRIHLIFIRRIFFFIFDHLHSNRSSSSIELFTVIYPSSVVSFRYLNTKFCSY